MSDASIVLSEVASEGVADFKVVILSYNHPELTRQTIESVLKLLPAEKILLVHNGSLPGHQSRLRELFPALTHLVLEKNRGYSGGANAGLRAAFKQTTWALFLTNDCQLLRWQKPPTDPGLGAPLIWARKVGQVDSMGGQFDIPKARLSHLRSFQEFNATKNCYVPGTAFWLHRNVFSATEGFQESLGTYWEDVDFSLRTRQAGFPIFGDDQTHILHRIGKTCHKDSHYTTYLYQRNRKKISWRYARGFFQKGTLIGVLATSWLELAGRFAIRRDWKRLSQLYQALRD